MLRTGGESFVNRQQHMALQEDDMSSRTAASVRSPSPCTSSCWASHANNCEAAFVYAEDPQSTRSELGHVDDCGDVYDNDDHRVGHATASIEDVGEIYCGYEHRVGYIRVALTGDGYVFTDADREHVLLGVVTVQGDIYAGHPGHKVGCIEPPLDAERMGAAALLLGLLPPVSSSGERVSSA
jgi:hypothetical protein